LFLEVAEELNSTAAANNDLVCGTGEAESGTKARLLKLFYLVDGAVKVVVVIYGGGGGLELMAATYNNAICRTGDAESGTKAQTPQTRLPPRRRREICPSF
jgi:hypothetical protein